MLNSDPKSGTQANLPIATRVGSNTLFSFTRRKDAAAAGYPSAVEISETLDLGSWSDVSTGILITDNPGNPTLLQDVVVTIPTAIGETKLFARLKVTTP